MRYFRLALPVFIAAIALTACGGNKSSSNASSSAASPMASAPAAAGAPDCGATQAVWANTRTKKYHEPGDPAYGNTKHGEYLCPAQAREQGFVPAGHGKRRHHRHHAHNGNGSNGDQSGSDQSGGDQSGSDQPESTSNP